MKHGHGTLHAVVGLIILILDIVAILSVLGGTSALGRKLLWLAIILLFPVIGVMISFLVGQVSEMSPHRFHSTGFSRDIAD